MTVAELIAELQKLPPHAPVWIQTVLRLLAEVRWEGNHVELSA